MLKYDSITVKNDYIEFCLTLQTYRWRESFVSHIKNSSDECYIPQNDHGSQ